VKDYLILEGSLDAILLPDVLTFVSMIKKTGRLELHRDDVEITFYLKRGEVVFAQSTDREDSLGLFLLRNGKISQDQYDESARALKPGLKHGKLLVKMGYLTPKDLWWGVKHQVLDIIYSTFSWNSGTFLFYEMPDSMVKQSIVIGTSTTSLIMEGIRRLDEWARIKEKIPNKNLLISRMEVPQEILNELELSPVEQKILTQLKDNISVQDVIRISGLSEFDACRVLLTLITAQAILLHEPAKEEAAETEDREVLMEIISGYADLYESIFQDLKETVGLERTQTIFREVQENQRSSSEVFEDITFDDSGSFDVGTILSNIADLPFEERKIILDDALNTFLSYLLFEVTQHLTPERKEALYHDVSERKARLEEIVKIDDLLT